MRPFVNVHLMALRHRSWIKEWGDTKDTYVWSTRICPFSLFFFFFLNKECVEHLRVQKQYSSRDRGGNYVFNNGLVRSSATSGSNGTKPWVGQFEIATRS